jgi:hypothetical protein
VCEARRVLDTLDLAVQDHFDRIRGCWQRHLRFRVSELRDRRAVTASGIGDLVQNRSTLAWASTSDPTRAVRHQRWVVNPIAFSTTPLRLP